MNKLKTFFLLSPFIGACAWAMYLGFFVLNAPKVILPITGYDPRNFLSGHYIEFRIDWAKADCNQLDWMGHCPKNDFIDVNRFYVPGDKAKRLESLINNSHISAQIAFAYKEGHRPIAKELLLNGQPWKDFLRTKNK